MEDGLKNKQLACEKPNLTTLREMVCGGIASKPQRQNQCKELIEYSI